jgi:urate oxidase
MHLSRFTYGKGRVRIMRVARATARHEVRELSVQVMLQGDFAASFTGADNANVIATDSIKNIVNLVARDHLESETEPFAQAVAAYFLAHYRQVDAVNITTHETKWDRMDIAGTAHNHAFRLDSNGQPTVHLAATRDGVTLRSGIEAYTFLKTTESGWVGYVMDDVTTLPETTDRIFATAMNAQWDWHAVPDGYAAAGQKILATMMEVFATTFSPSVQNSLYLMGSAALEAVPEISAITLACPNKHYIPLNLSPFNRDNPNVVFLPTDDPHGQIECTVTRG